jgi:dATP pyrophosphohydrolase
VSSIVSRTVEVCVFRREHGVPAYLLLKRSEKDRLYPGIWQFVTGTMKDGESAVRAARRELYEETGLDIERFWVVPFVNTFYLAASDTVHLSPFFAAEANAGGQVHLSHEHQDSQWCAYKSAGEKLVWPGQRHGLQLVHEYIVGGQEASRLLSVSV